MAGERWKSEDEIREDAKKGRGHHQTSLLLKGSGNLEGRRGIPIRTFRRVMFYELSCSDFLFTIYYLDEKTRLLPRSN